MSENAFTHSVIKTFERATIICENARNPMVTDLHFMKAALESPSNPLAQFLSIMGVNTAGLAMEVNKALGNEPVSGNATAPQPSQMLSNHLNRASTLRDKFNDKFASLELYLLAVVEDDNHNNSLLKLLKATNQGQEFNPKRIAETIQFLRQGRTVDTPEENALDDEIKDFIQDFTKLAEEGKLDPVIGRHEEINRCLQILQRRTKNNPVLIGKPGVGKTAVVEGLAQLIVRGEVPETIKGARILSLNIGSLMSGTQYRGQFEEKVKKLLESITSENSNTILFIDEIHQIVSANQGADSGLNLANMLKPALSRGEIHCIGATTLNEYRQYIEKDSALERRFQKILIDEPTVEDTINILRGLKEKYSLHHKVQISDSAIISAAVLSNRYITDRTLPDKAIDLIDEAASKINMEISSEPSVMVTLRNDINELKVSEFTLAKEKDEETQKTLEEIRKNIYAKEKEYASLKEVLVSEKELLNKIQKLKERLDSLNFDLEKATANSDYELVSRIQYSEIPQVRQELVELESHEKDFTLIRTRVTEKEICEIIAQTTGIPLNKLQESERDKLLNLEAVLRERVVGQDEAIKLVSDAVRRSRAHIQDDKKPIGSFLFLGTTGVGKTELAKALAYQLFDNDEAFIRIDMSEYMEKHSISRLIGSPPGYVGYEQGGQLTEAVRRAPYSIVLFDEIEKAHPDVFNIFLQILDNGQLTDSQGRIVNFRNTVIIMTSNIGSREIMEYAHMPYEALRKVELDILKTQIKPEILNRFDDIVIFHPLQKEHMQKIANIQIKRLNERLKFQQIALVVTQGALDVICNLGYDVEFGARPLKRTVTSYIENPLSKIIIAGEARQGDIIEVTNNPAYKNEEETPDIQPLEFKILEGQYEQPDELAKDATINQEAK